MRLAIMGTVALLRSRKARTSRRAISFHAVCRTLNPSGRMSIPSRTRISLISVTRSVKTFSIVRGPNDVLILTNPSSVSWVAI